MGTQSSILRRNLVRKHCVTEPLGQRTLGIRRAGYCDVHEIKIPALSVQVTYPLTRPTLSFHLLSMRTMNSTFAMNTENANNEMKDFAPLITKVAPANTFIKLETNSELGTNDYPKDVALLSTLLSLALGTFLMALDTTIITVEIPEISTHFNALDQVGWIGSAYLITLTAFQPIAGNLYKSFDLKLIYLGFMFMFEGRLKVTATPYVL
jgi:hypothetical protein